MKWFGKSVYRPVNGTDSEDQIEVDQISFTSSCSSGEIDEEKEKSVDLIRFDDLEMNININEPGPSEISMLSIDSPINENSLKIPEYNEPTTSKEVYNEGLFVRSSIFWFNDNEVDKSKLTLPISNRGRVCRFENEVDDNHLETMCRALQITTGITERSRWLNVLAKNPVMAELARQLDEDFGKVIETSPSDNDIDLTGFEMRTPSNSVSTVVSSVSGSFKAISLNQQTSVELSPNPTFSKGFIRTVVPARKGIDSIELRRKVNESVSSICSVIVKKTIEVDPPIDKRMVAWMRGFAEADTWIPEIAPASRKHDNYSYEVPPLSEDWILHVHKPIALREGLEKQQWKCAQCRQSLTNSHILNDKELCPRFCEYYGFYFCTLCHGGDKSIIPSKIISLWNFQEALVCDRAYRFLRAVRELPVFRIREISGDLIKKNKSLRNVIDLRAKLKDMEQYIKICVSASEQVTDFGNLGTMFASLDRYLLESDDLFSLNDLLRVYNKDLLNLLEPIAKHSRAHILRCNRCSDDAKVCVKCNDLTDKLFPFEERVARCIGCGGLSHAPKCPRRDVPKDSSCPKCARLLKSRPAPQRQQPRLLSFSTGGN
ncbi:unnamed protein product [Caenorhabditis angaria]|uniref:Rubicon Homology domain-containing protein n=1 Tax=Caenorhabditis angaria TaxID=860376 RepID=A0A9P1N394_9PELO|nr:unnamed protein product [Caenorhabditis angaria]